MENTKNYYALLMAGGVGSRFWPVSTQAFPKQFHDMLGTGETLLQKTFNRLAKIVPEDQILILTNTDYNDLVKEQLPNIKQKNIVLEPAMRNTAPCILLSALKVEKENPDAVMVVAPSDAWIEDEDAFVEDLQKAFDAAQQEETIVTLGIQPSFPNTGYGYINYDKSDNAFAKAVKRFTEKPDYPTAKEFVASGEYLWNAGMFIWSVKTVVNSFKSFLPDMYSLLNEGNAVYNLPEEQDFINEAYPKAENISIDFGVMEKHQNVKVVPATFDWNDLGTWGSLYDKMEGTSGKDAVVNARIIATNTSGNIIRTASNKVVVVDGLKDYIIVEKEDVLVIVPKSKEQDIKEIRNEVQSKFGNNLG
ncbi:mannose-1-phosphate guanylyltransferase [Dokdonia sp. Hel_I_63]|jgi:mannose-1-phosphate guanylyltransferase|uniref:mannose-1-phosphate guanylyltransferase n=1 Tax=unclassified Dokdonia TaxID=2615033 RepID=UPI00119C45EF|nr:mannose-1-phosphate guanylyltransferase [Dokdonia sp. Hel_I_63]TVZ22214.1 mannose-1-phosphate guanylyltransferase [Dokdonia sp. Hel_I_63]